MTYATEKLKLGRKPLVILELDLDTCAEVYGNALTSPVTGACTAAGASGSECYNTQFTCQDVLNFSQTTKTYRFCEPVQGLPAGIEMIPSIVSVTSAPTKITSDYGLGHRASITVTLQDHPHHDRGVDPYVSTRSYNPETQGTYWGRLRARTPYYQGRTMRLRVGYMGDAAEGIEGVYTEDGEDLIRTDQFYFFETREYVIEEIRGPDSSGRVQVIGKDVLKLADDKRSKCPVATDGELAYALTTSDTQMTVVGGTYTDPATSPTTNQWVRVGDEIIQYTGISGSGTAGDPWILTGLVRTDITWGSANESHAVEDQVQQCKAWQDTNVRDIIEELLVDYAGVSSGYITTADWDAEEAQWLSAATLTAIISEPTGVSTLISELQDQCMVRIWWDEISQKVRFKAIAPPTGVEPDTLNDESNILSGSLSIKDVPKDRLSQVWIYYDKKDYTSDDVGNYQKLYIQTDTNAESAVQYNESRIHTIKSQWFDEDNKAFLAQTAARHLSNYRDNPREIVFSLDAKDNAIKTGDIVDINIDDIQGADGAALTTRVMVVQAKEAVAGHEYQYTCMTGIGAERYGNIGWPDTESPIMPDYTAATEATQLAYAFICNSTTLKMSNGDESYKII